MIPTIQSSSHRGAGFLHFESIIVGWCWMWSSLNKWRSLERSFKWGFFVGPSEGKLYFVLPPRSLLDIQEGSLLDFLFLLVVSLVLVLLDNVDWSFPIVAYSDSATSSYGSSTPSTPIMILEGVYFSGVPGSTSSATAGVASSSSSSGESGNCMSVGRGTPPRLPVKERWKASGWLT